jgi:hypothetical protein
MWNESCELYLVNKELEHIACVGGSTRTQSRETKAALRRHLRRLSNIAGKDITRWASKESFHSQLTRRRRRRTIGKPLRWQVAQEQNLRFRFARKLPLWLVPEGMHVLLKTCQELIYRNMKVSYKCIRLTSEFLVHVSPRGDRQGSNEFLELDGSILELFMSFIEVARQAQRRIGCIVLSKK